MTATDPKQLAITLNDMLRKKQAAFADIAEKHLDPERMIRVLLSAASRNQRLLECTPQSMLAVMIDCARWGLEPTGRGGVWPVPYRNKRTGQMEAQAVTDYRGEIAIVRRTGLLSEIRARIVYAKDSFEFSSGDEESLLHKPVVFGDRGPVLGAYAVAKLKDGGIYREVLSKGEIEATRLRSKASQHGPWVTDWEAMAKKTVLRRVCNLLPMPSAYTERVSREDEVERDDGVATVVDVKSEPPASMALEVLRRLESTSGEDEELPVSVPSNEAGTPTEMEPPLPDEDPLPQDDGDKPQQGNVPQDAESNTSICEDTAHGRTDEAEGSGPAAADSREPAVGEWPADQGPLPQHTHPLYQIQAKIAGALGSERGHALWRRSCPALKDVADNEAQLKTAMTRANTVLKKALLATELERCAKDLAALGGSDRSVKEPEYWTIAQLRGAIGNIETEIGRIEKKKGM